MPVNRIDFWKHALDSSIKESSDLRDAWRVIEAKAQPLTAIAGALLAGVVAYSQSIQKITFTEKLLLAAICIFLLISVQAFLRAIKIVEVSSPHLGDGTAQEVRDILENTSPPETWERRYENLLADTTDRWSESNTEAANELTRKTSKLNQGILNLSLAVGFLFFLAVFKVFWGMEQ